MKKIIGFAVSAMMAVSALCAQSVTLTNTFGGDSDNIGTEDFLSFDKEQKMQDVGIGDRLQLDVSSEKIDSRVRLDFDTTKLNGKNSTIRVRGYANFKPAEFINIVAGNEFFSKFGIKGAYLAANDDYTCYGKLTDNNGIGLLLKFGDLKISSSFELSDTPRINLNFGAEYEIKNLVTLSAIAQDVTEKSRSFGGYVSLDCVENFMLNLGYVYNHGDTSYLSSTQNAILLSTGYDFSDIGFGIYLDAGVGLNNVKANGSNEKYSDSGVPFYGALLLSYDVLENTNVSLLSSMNIVPEDNAKEFCVYPSVEVKTSVGSFLTGVRVNFSEEGYEGVSIPFSWKYKFKIK